MDIELTREEIMSELEENRQKIYSKYTNPEKTLIWIKDKFAAPFVFSSLILSGTEVEKTVVEDTIKEGFVDPDGNQITGKEILEHNDAYEKIFKLAKEPVITEDHLKALHTLLFNRTGAEGTGKYTMGKEKAIRTKLKAFLEWFNNNGDGCDDITFCATTYQRYIYIHPFKGGNGKMARLMMNLAALKRKFTIITIPADEKNTYDEIIKASKRDVTEFTNYIMKCALYSQRVVRKLQKEVYSVNKSRHIRNLDFTEDVYKIILGKPGIKTVEIKAQIKKISLIKLQREIRMLREKNLIEFRGAIRNGGYYPIEENIGKPVYEEGEKN
ncbi:MAG: Fic family protein [Bacteroidales bacterium]|nr:Fic family protein [Bacteroidales bacterium]